MPVDLISPYAAIAEAVAALLAPHAEVVLHDLRSGRIAGLWHALSGRRIGDASLLDDDPGLYEETPVLGPYAQTGPRGERFKSVTATLPGLQLGGPPIGLLCINLDVSNLERARDVLAALASVTSPQPASLFAKDWREHAQAVMHDWLRAQGVALAGLTRTDRIALMAAMDRHGCFETRRAVEHVAGLIGVSRAAAYGYLAQARKETDA